VLALLVAVLVTILSACSQSSTTTDPYGGPQNHLHDILALGGVPHTVLVASHYGLYRSSDDGQQWTTVAGTAGQQADGLMLYKLAQSPINPQRVYVLATKRQTTQNGTPGLYTSADAGRTWQLAAPLTDFSTQSIYTIGAGSAGPDQIYAILPGLAERGLSVSNDAGHTWQSLPAMPTAAPTGVTGDPTHAGRIFLWSKANGFFSSDDNGQHWSAASGIQGGIFSVSAAGATVYASGDSGLFVSQDGGVHFTLANNDNTYSTVVACQSDPSHAYALVGTSVYATTDTGHTWNATAATTQHPGNLTVDPASAGHAYVGFSYPVGIAATTDGGSHWSGLLP
jgi:photosystem II stability/assembly factor-like uncharacterized protein